MLVLEAGIRMEVKSDVTSKETMISSGWMVVFLSFVKKDPEDNRLELLVPISEKYNLNKE